MWSRNLLTCQKHLSSPSVFGSAPIAQSLVFCVVFCRSLFVLLSIFLCSLCCLSFDLRLLINPLVYLAFPCHSFVHCVACPLMDKRMTRKGWIYQRVNQKPQIEGQATQWTKEWQGKARYTKGLIRSLKSKDRQHNGQKNDKERLDIPKG
jgi:hypothetical protein